MEDHITEFNLEVDVTHGENVEDNCTSKRHLSLLGVEENPACLKFRKSEETSFRLLEECEKYERLRFEIFQVVTVHVQKEGLSFLAWIDTSSS